MGFFRFDVEALGSGAAGGLERGVEALDVPFTVDALEVVRFDGGHGKSKSLDTTTARRTFTAAALGGFTALLCTEGMKSSSSVVGFFDPLTVGRGGRGRMLFCRVQSSYQQEK